MATVRTTCPSCDTILIDAADLTVHRRFGSDQPECSFVCPECTEIVVQGLSDRMVPVLIGAGCMVEDWGLDDAAALHPSAGRITEAEIEAFVAALDRDDWFGDLTR